jgi:hypothetical protein
MSINLLFWSIVVLMVAAAVVDDIHLRRTLNVGRPRRDPVDAPGKQSGDEQDRAKFFGSDGNNERILGVLQSIYPFAKRPATRPLATRSVEPIQRVG